MKALLSNRWAQLIGALVVFALALAWVFKPLLVEGIDQVALTNEFEVDVPDVPFLGSPLMAQTDLRFDAWATAINARGLVERPLRPFDAPACHPTPRALALGHPLLTYGVLGLPAWLATRDPLVTFNFALLVQALLGALAMFVLVRDWTGSAFAALVAGLLYGVGEPKLWNVVQMHHQDTSWTVWALFFVRRLLEHGRYRDAVGTAGAVILQAGVSMYTLLASALVLVPVTVALVVARGVQRLPVGPCVAALGLAALGVGSLVAPYLVMQSAGAIGSDLKYTLPFHQLFSGEVASLAATLLAGWYLAVGARFGPKTLRGKPRWSLLVGALASVALSTGSSWGSGGLYGWLATWLTPLAVVRVPAALAVGAHVGVCVLAGLGVASLVSWAGARGRLAQASLGAVAVLASVVSVGGIDPGASRYGTLPMRPAPETLDFYAELAAQGDTGAILELPMNPNNPIFVIVTTNVRQWTAAWHGRPTSACYNSYASPDATHVYDLATALPDGAAASALREMGFTTIVLHHEPATRESRRLAKALAVAAGSGGGIAELARGSSLSAWSLPDVGD